MEDVPAATPISTIFIPNRSHIPSEIVFCSRDALLHQVVDEFVGVRIMDSQKE